MPTMATVIFQWPTETYRVNPTINHKVMARIMEIETFQMAIQRHVNGKIHMTIMVAAIIMAMRTDLSREANGMMAQQLQISLHN